MVRMDWISDGAMTSVVYTYGLNDESVRTDPMADLITVSVSSMLNASMLFAASVMLSLLSL
jgi:hypothetical protein